MVSTGALREKRRRWLRVMNNRVRGQCGGGRTAYYIQEIWSAARIDHRGNGGCEDVRT